ncbi:hypothetical protein AZZ84_000933, partial [Escherichia coli]
AAKCKRSDSGGDPAKRTQRRGDRQRRAPATGGIEKPDRERRKSR